MSNRELVLGFLRPRWSIGKGWWASWARFFAGSRGVTMQAWRKATGQQVAGQFVELGVWAGWSYAQKEDWVLDWIKRLRYSGKSTGKPLEAHDAGWVQTYPALHEYLTCTLDDGGKPRLTATLNIFTEGGAFKLFLNDRSENASLCATGSTVSEALGALETMLESPNPGWRLKPLPEPPGGKNGRRNR